MPRSVFGLSPAVKPSMAHAPSATRTSAATRAPSARLSLAELDARLRLPRSKAYLQALASLDAGGHGLSPADRAEIADIVRAEFPELTVDQLPQGFVAKCHLGDPYEVHTFDLQSGEIIAHYRTGEALPGGLERGRALAMHGAYALVEVYGTDVRGISPSGRATGPAGR